jgi:hypothetical protein
MLRPSFQAADLTLLHPTRVCNDADATASALVKNPDDRWLMASVEQDGRRIGDNSPATNSETARLECPLPSKGTYRMKLWIGNQQYGAYDYVGSVDFVSR